MKINLLSRHAWLVAACAMACSASAGCHSKVSEATMPQAFYSGRDDLQYFPPGPEFSQHIKAIEEYRARQQGLESAEPAGNSEL